MLSFDLCFLCCLHRALVLHLWQKSGLNGELNLVQCILKLMQTCISKDRSCEPPDNCLVGKNNF
jgi:hypothetical protein